MLLTNGKTTFQCVQVQNSTKQVCNLYRKVAEDMVKELERSTSFYRKATDHLLGERARVNWNSPMLTERKLRELGKENYLNRQILAKIKSQF